MQPLLFLTHRLPWPPERGDKVRSHRLLCHLAKRYRLFLGTFVDEAVDWHHVDAVRSLCADACIRPLDACRARLRSTLGLLRGEPLTLSFYRDRRLHDWIDHNVRTHAISQAVVFSGAMAQYVVGIKSLSTIVDFVDVDSQKWRQYARARPWPVALIYQREAKHLLEYERFIASHACASLFVSQQEAALFAEQAPEARDTTVVMGNGVDTNYFSPCIPFASPFGHGEQAIVFTGVMDYWPNVDAVSWFGKNVFPQISHAYPRARFYIVGMKPSRSVQALADQPGIMVTGRVQDVRPYLSHARVVVAPMRIARGVQNKILEAMAMRASVVASEACAGPLGATAGQEFEVARTAQEFADAVGHLLDSPRRLQLGTAARAWVEAAHDWQTHLAVLDRLLQKQQRASGTSDLATSQIIGADAP